MVKDDEEWLHESVGLKFVGYTFCSIVLFGSRVRPVGYAKGEEEAKLLERC